MTEHELDIRIDGELTDDRIEQLFEAGCGDMTFTGGEGFTTSTALVKREGPTFLDAAFSAIRDIEKVDGLRVVGVDAEDLVSMADIARRLGRSHQSVKYLVDGKRGPGGFPAPDLWIDGKRPAWEWADVTAWTDANLGTNFGDDPTARAGRALNAALALRQADESDRRPLLAFVQQEDVPSDYESGNESGGALRLGWKSLSGGQTSPAPAPQPP